MINLLPQQQKKKISAEYKTRLATVSAVLLLVAIIISTIAITPFYFGTKVSLDRVKKIYANYENSPDLLLDSDSEKIISEVDNKIKTLSGYDKQKHVSIDVLDKVTTKKGETISISSIEFSDKEGKSVVSIGGVAENREELKSFVYRLMKVETFTNVSVPISNYLKGVDLEFVITLNLIK